MSASSARTLLLSFAERVMEELEASSARVKELEIWRADILALLEQVDAEEAGSNDDGR